VPAWLAAVGIKIPGLSFIAPLTPPLSYMAYGVGGFMVVGLICLIVTYLAAPQRVREVGLVHLEIED
jgi:hypothetical protein